MTGGLEAAHEFCTIEAGKAGLATAQSTWRAILATDSKSAFWFTGRSPQSKPVYNTQGEIVATTRAELWSAATLTNPVRYDQFGVSKTSPIASGAKRDGTYAGESCAGWKDPQGSLGLGQGNSGLATNSWISGESGANCTSVSIYCLGDRVAAQGTPTNTPTQTATITPSLTPSSTQTHTPTSTVTPQPTTTPTSTSTVTPTPLIPPTRTPTLAPTNTATPTPGNSNSTPPPKPTDPTGGQILPSPGPTGTPGFISTRPIPDNAIGGEVLVAGKPFAGALVYIPELIDVALSDKQGFYSFIGVDPPKVKVTIKIRSTQLEKGGYDIPSQAGIFVEVRPRALAMYNPQKCPENDKLSALYTAALHLRFMYRSALNDHKLLLQKLTSGEAKRETGRAINRTKYHSSFYLDLSAMLPDRQLRCTQKTASCSEVDLRDVVRKMRFSATQVRRESLLFNRQLRQKQLRPEKQSNTTMKKIRDRSQRLQSLISKLPRSTNSCTPSGSAQEISILPTNKKP